MTSDLACTGDPAVVEEGRKSFPSGHTGCQWSLLYNAVLKLHNYTVYCNVT